MIFSTAGVVGINACKTLCKKLYLFNMFNKGICVAYNNSNFQ